MFIKHNLFNMIMIKSKRKKPATTLKKYPNAILADVTCSAKDGLVKLSPFSITYVSLTL